MTQYKSGKYTYKSKQEYIDTLAIIFVVFFVSGYFISFSREYLGNIIYFISVSISIIMMIHLTFKYAHARGKINYVFNEY
ncbi:MAG: hypothetical protein VX028_02525 [Nanoarchaeota archaeon]|nr:hypothetical protein [Nanoarchaeota archaeon]